LGRGCAGGLLLRLIRHEKHGALLEILTTDSPISQRVFLR